MSRERRGSKKPRICPECRTDGFIVDEHGYRCPNCGKEGDITALMTLATQFDLLTVTCPRFLYQGL